MPFVYDKARDQRLKRTYGITQAEWEAMFDAQGRRCAICGKPEPPPDKRPFHTDHDHTFRYLTVRKEKLTEPWHDLPVGAWYAEIEALRDVYAFRRKRNDAIRACREQAKRASVRGIICWQCNAGLKKFGDNPLALAEAAEYLKRHKERAHPWPSSTRQEQPKS